MLSIRGGLRGDGDGSHDELGCCGGACFGGKMTLDSSYYCRDVRRLGLARYKRKRGNNVV